MEQAAPTVKFSKLCQSLENYSSLTRADGAEEGIGLLTADVMKHSKSHTVFPHWSSQGWKDIWKEGGLTVSAEMLLIPISPPAAVSSLSIF